MNNCNYLFLPVLLFIKNNSILSKNKEKKRKYACVIHRDYAFKINKLSNCSELIFSIIIKILKSSIFDYREKYSKLL